MEEQNNGRPTFLTVLCILTFIGSGFGLIGGIMNYALAPVAGEMTSEMMEQMDDELATEDINDNAASFIENIMSSSIQMAEHASELALISVLGALLSLTGAILMFRLDKKGFYLYAGAQALIVFAPVIFTGINFVSGMSMAMGGFFAALFIVMYGVNLKNMS